MMTGKQVISAIKLTLDKYSASTSAVIGPAFLDEELCSFANLAMILTVCTKFTGNNQLLQGFELSVKRVSDLERLIELSEHTITVDLHNRYVTEANAIDDNHLFLVSAAVKITFDGKSYDTYPAEYVDRKTAEKFLKTPINYPWIPVPKVTSFLVRDTKTNTLTKGLAVYIDPDLLLTEALGLKLSTEWVVLPDGLTIDSLYELAFGGVFSDAVLYEIINKAALLMLDNIESLRTQVKSELNKLQE